MGWASGLRDAKISERGVFLGAGVYDVAVEKMLMKKTRKSGDCFIVELRLLATSDPANHPIGSKRTWMQKMADADVALGSIKSFMYAALGADATDPADQEKRNEIDNEIEETTEAACTDEQVLKGNRLHLTVVMTKTKAEKDFSRHNWSPCTLA